MFLRARKQNIAAFETFLTLWRVVLSAASVYHSDSSRLHRQQISSLSVSDLLGQSKSNTCFLHSSFPAPAYEIAQLQTSFAHYTALNGQALKSSNTKRAGTITTALVFEKTSSSKHTQNNLASPSALSFKTPMAKAASEICKICTCQTGNVQMWKGRQQMCSRQGISQSWLGQLEGFSCTSTDSFLQPRQCFCTTQRTALSSKLGKKQNCLVSPQKSLKACSPSIMMKLKANLYPKQESLIRTFALEFSTNDQTITTPEVTFRYVVVYITSSVVFLSIQFNLSCIKLPHL